MNILPTSVLLVLLIICTSSPANAVHFLLTDNEPYCFVEEVGGNTNAVTGEYTRNSVPDGSQVEATITIHRSDGVQAYASNLLVGTHAFSANTNQEQGQYTLCVQVTRRNWRATTEDAIPIDFNTDQKVRPVTAPTAPVVQRQKVNGEEVFSFRDFSGQQKNMLMNANYVTRLETGLDHVSILLDEAQSEIFHLLERFTRMRRTSESTFTRIWSCGVVIVLTSVLVIWLQFRYLKLTLRRKKLV